MATIESTPISKANVYRDNHDQALGKAAKALAIQSTPVGGGSSTTIQQIIQQTVVTIQQSTYFFRGFYPTTGQYETWSGTSRNTPPPTGHSLIDITVTGIL